ncbi:PaREP1 family protein [Vulcanisaeta distributa]|uniref:PaREP1 family protein n=1 Tax=Vulcanisaeta distributa (strain DSM 14429 / JCM 11212 / NBRC 100878 / IC-017) TaxID=572478 RepID=E1QTY9_VULDI|nr:PaREP1 family protein [Vulcanisaeta distributa]ADN49786.1 PaREP1 family protein [Vulcanisaeta distributa DSM 14429]
MEELIRMAEERGIDVEDLIINAIRSRSKDPLESIRLRIELARKFITEARERLNTGDSIQASEKAYKAAEEVVKALAEKFNIPEYQQAIKEGRWYTHQLSSAASKLSRTLGNWVLNGWSSAYLLHVWGFHEAKLSADDIVGYVNEVERMVKEAEKLLTH